MPSLVVIAGPLAGKVIAVDRSLVLGRAETDVIIDDPELSRRHLEVRPDGELLLAEDPGVSAPGPSRRPVPAHLCAGCRPILHPRTRSRPFIGSGGVGDV